MEQKIAARYCQEEINALATMTIYSTWKSCAIVLDSRLKCCCRASGLTADPSGLRLKALVDELKGFQPLPVSTQKNC